MRPGIFSCVAQNNMCCLSLVSIRDSQEQEMRRPGVEPRTCRSSVWRSQLSYRGLLSSSYMPLNIASTDNLGKLDPCDRVTCEALAGMRVGVLALAPRFFFWRSAKTLQQCDPLTKTKNRTSMCVCVCWFKNNTRNVPAPKRERRRHLFMSHALEPIEFPVLIECLRGCLLYRIIFGMSCLRQCLPAVLSTFFTKLDEVVRLLGSDNWFLLSASQLKACSFLPHTRNGVRECGNVPSQAYRRIHGILTNQFMSKYTQELSAWELLPDLNAQCLK